MAIPVAWPLRILGWLLLGVSCYRAMRVHAWRLGTSAIVAIEMDGEGAALVRFAQRVDWQPCEIISRFVHPRLTLLSLKLESRRWPVSLVIAADAVEPEPFRRWRVALKLHAVPA